MRTSMARLLVAAALLSLAVADDLDPVSGMMQQCGGGKYCDVSSGSGSSTDTSSQAILFVYNCQTSGSTYECLISGRGFVEAPADGLYSVDSTVPQHTGGQSAHNSLHVKTDSISISCDSCSGFDPHQSVTLVGGRSYIILRTIVLTLQNNIHAEKAVQFILERSSGDLCLTISPSVQLYSQLPQTQIDSSENQVVAADCDALNASQLAVALKVLQDAGFITINKPLTDDALTSAAILAQP